MISLKQSLTALEQKDELFRTSLECYVSAIQSVHDSTLETTPEEAERHRLRLDGLQRDIRTDPSRTTLEHTRDSFRTQLREYHERVQEVFAEREDNVRTILRSLADAAQFLKANNDQYSQQFRGFAEQLEVVSHVNDLGEVKRRLSSEVAALKSCIEAMCMDNGESVKRLEAELQVYESRLKAVEQAAYIDPLTGLPNRRDAERRLQEKIQAKSTFCLLLIDLNRFRFVNDRFGQHAGDQVLKAFARRLAGEVRPSDMVCRWEGDEFLILVECSLSDAMRRAYQMGPRLRGRYTVTSEGKEHPVDVGASLGVAEYLTGETMEQLFSRADAALRRQRTVESGR